MSVIENPFITQGYAGEKYFCDRREESEKLIRSVTNGNNLVLLSPRRMGKTGLIQHCYNKPQIRKKYQTVYVDILHTGSLREFTYVLGKEVYESLVPKGQKTLREFITALKSLSGKFGFDPVSGMPVFNLQMGDIQDAGFTLKEIFGYLAASAKPCIVAIDELQQVAKYKEKNVEALLRGYIQKSGNCRFIFSGSERHLMEEMFTSSARPFFNSADMLELKPIPKESYLPFIVEMFESGGKKIAAKDAQKVYDLFKGHTFYVQKTFNEAYSYTPARAKCTLEVISLALKNVVLSYDTMFRESLSNISDKQKELLYAIAQEGEAHEITGTAFIQKYRMDSASSVQSAVQKLLDKSLVTRLEQTYSLNNKFLELWINLHYGTGWNL